MRSGRVVRSVITSVVGGGLTLAWLAPPAAHSAVVVAEKDVNLLIAKEVATRLSAAGGRVVMTRGNDASIPLGARTALANVQHADVFVSIHNNAGVRGASWSEVYRQVVDRPGSGALATSLTRAVNAAFGGRRSVRLFGRSGRDRDYYFVLRNTNMAAALVEGAFMSTPAEAGALARSGPFRSTIASGIANGVLDYERGLAPAPAPNLPPGMRTQVDALPVPASVDGAASSAWRVALSWSASSALPQYRVYRDGQLLAVLDNPAFGALGAPPPPMSFVDRWTAPGQRYHYEVRGAKAIVTQAMGAKDIGAGRVLESKPGLADVQTPAILVVLDAGHGGADPGALGRY